MFLGYEIGNDILPEISRGVSAKVMRKGRVLGGEGKDQVTKC